jgi:hypothetical protein
MAKQAQGIVIRVIVTTFSVSLATAFASNGATTSALWGEAGELWQTNRPLKDFSFAGYHDSEVPPPDIAVSVNIRDFGGRGDGRTDDTGALLKAIAACPIGGKVFLPAGDYMITDLIEINRSVVIAGAGMDRTKLILPNYLVDLHPRPGNTSGHNPAPLWSWSGGYIEFNNTSEVGIEDLTFQFPETPYLGHFKEHGSNGVNFEGCHDGWARRLRFVNADSGVFASNSRHITVRDIEFDAYKGRSSLNREGLVGHHAVDFMHGSSLCLGDEIHFKVKFYHELGIEHGANGNVYSRCDGPDMVLDHHQPNVHGNLWTDIDVGKGVHIWINNSRGSTMDEVYWNIRAARNILYPDPKLKNIVVGLTGPGMEIRGTNAPWAEVIAPADLEPQNLFQAQLEKRIGAAQARAVLKN